MLQSIYFNDIMSMCFDYYYAAKVQQRKEDDLHLVDAEHPVDPHHVPSSASPIISSRLSRT